MYPATDRFTATLATDHNPLSVAQLLLTDGQVLTLDITGGTVPVDRGSAVRRTCSVTLADVTLIPRTPTDQLAVYGARLRLSRGVAYADGTTELVPLGLFRVDEVSGDVDMGPVTIGGVGLEQVVSDDKFTAPYRATGTAASAITGLIQRSIPGAAILNRATDTAIGARTYDIQADPWTAVTECAAAIGAECYADADGVFVIAELPDLLAATPVWTVAAGPGGVYVSANRGMSADGVYNAVYATGENSEAAVAPVHALVVDNDPGSPTYWSGPFGHRPTFYSSATLISTGMCTAAATLKLRAAVAPNSTADISTMPNPALEPGDVIRVIYPDGSKELHQVQSLTIPLDVGGAFTIQTISAKEGA